MTEVLDRIRGAMVGLKMPRALEALDHTMQRLEQGEITAIEAIDSLLSEEYSTRDAPDRYRVAHLQAVADQDVGKLRLQLPALIGP